MTGSHLFWYLQEHSGDHRKDGDQEREEGPGDELQWVDLQGSGDKNTGNAPWNDSVDCRTSIVQDPGEELTLEAQLVK